MLSFSPLVLAVAAAGLCAAEAASRQPTDTCTIRTYEVQRCDRTSKRPVTYAQVNEIKSLDQHVLVNVRQQRPMNAFHSYNRLTPKEPWVVADLPEENGGSTLSITLNGTDDTLTFSYGSHSWSEADAVNDDAAVGCETGGWFDMVGPFVLGPSGQWECGSARVASKRRILDCRFPCERAERLELV